MALKLILKEAHSDTAEGVLTDTLVQGVALYVSPLALAEVTDVLLQRVRRGVRSAAEVQRALADFLQLPLQHAHPAGLYEHALAFALTSQLRSAYDTTSVVLARLLEVPHWTADLHLITTLGGAASWVRWIGDYPLPGTEVSPRDAHTLRR